MRIINHTKYQYHTREIRWITTQVFYRHFHPNSNGTVKHRWDRLEIHLYPAKNTRTDHCWVHGTSASVWFPWVTLRLKAEIDPAEFAGLIHHELFHTLYQVHHRDFPNSIMWCHLHPERYSWAREKYGGRINLKTGYRGTGQGSEQPIEKGSEGPSSDEKQEI